MHTFIQTNGHTHISQHSGLYICNHICQMRKKKSNIQMRGDGTNDDKTISIRQIFLEFISLSKFNQHIICVILETYENQRYTSQENVMLQYRLNEREMGTIRQIQTEKEDKTGRLSHSAKWISATTEAAEIICENGVVRRCRWNRFRFDSVLKKKLHSARE